MTEAEDANTFQLLMNTNTIHLLRLLSAVPILNSSTTCMNIPPSSKVGCISTSHPMSTIPNKIRSKPQQRLYEKRRDKRERHKLRKPIAPNVPYDVFIANEQQQRDALQQRTQSVIARKEEQMRKIPEHMKFDSADDIDMNDTISYNYQNTRTSSRAIRPSAAMLESMKYQKRMNGQPQ
eukprot:144873_1